jgi:hypothetical protein
VKDLGAFGELGIGDCDRRQLLARQIGSLFGDGVLVIEMDNLPPIRQQRINKGR